MSANQLANSTSPYLRQHADNPVHWYPWGEDALLEARKSNKPILLSIGYAACHWCHVMARESFSCEQTAEIMNRLFVNVKVDKEERPDLDKIYQTAHALISRHSGGWPLTIFLEPQSQKPFFSGTYFPKEPRFNVPPFRDVLQRVHSFYMQHQNEVQSYGEEISRALGQIYAPGQRGKISDGVLSRAVNGILDSYDRKNGGFGDAPKFPAPGYLNILLAQALTEAATGSDKQPIEQTTGWRCFIHCLTAMSQSGLYDQLGGGYFRYTVDAQWSVPHFEKMLYDNGQLLSLMADAQAIHGNPELAEKTRETVDWLTREMRSEGGAFYSSLDADSDGVEGQFYLWDKDEVKKLLDEKDYAVACMHFGLDQPANCEGQWNLRRSTSLESLAEKTSQSAPALERQLKQIKQRMFQQRTERVRPHRDDKIMVGWNSLVINGLAKAAIAVDEKDYYQTGKAALDFIRERLWRDNTLHTAGIEGGEPWHSAYLDDYASLIEAILSMLQYRWDDDDLRFALQLADAALEKFEDKQNGGYFFTAADQERLLQRPRLLHDDSAPAGYGVMALSLTRLGWLCGREDYLNSADKALTSAAETLERSPHNCSHLLLLHEEIKNPPPMVIIRSLDGHGREWLAAARKTIGRKLCFDVPADAKPPPALAAKKTLTQTAAYLCYGTHCSQPIENLQEFKRQLNQ